MSFKKYTEGTVKSIMDFYECSCNSSEHSINFKMFDDEDCKELYLSVHLITHNSLIKRCWVALKYVFGYKCLYGDFDEFIFKKQDVIYLKTLLDYYLEKNKE